MDNKQFEDLTGSQSKIYGYSAKVIIVLGTLCWFCIPYQYFVGNAPEWLFYSLLSIFTGWMLLMVLGSVGGLQILALEYAILGQYKTSYKDYLYIVILVLSSVLLYNMKHEVYALIIFVSGFINHHYKTLAFKLAKEAVDKALEKLQNNFVDQLQQIADKLEKDSNKTQNKVGSGVDKGSKE